VGTSDRERHEVSRWYGSGNVGHWGGHRHRDPGCAAKRARAVQSVKAGSCARHAEAGARSQMRGDKIEAHGTGRTDHVKSPACHVADSTICIACTGRACEQPQEGMSVARAPKTPAGFLRAYFTGGLRSGGRSSLPTLGSAQTRRGVAFFSLCLHPPPDTTPPYPSAFVAGYAPRWRARR